MSYDVKAFLSNYFRAIGDKSFYEGIKITKISARKWAAQFPGKIVYGYESEIINALVDYLRREADKKRNIASGDFVI